MSIANRQVIYEVLAEAAQKDHTIYVICSDSRGSSAVTPFFEKFPLQSIEIGIAEQNLVSVAAGIASCGNRSFVISPACFISARSYEQVKIDVAYSDTNVKLVGVSGGVAYGAGGMTHHSTNDIAALCALPNMRVYLPCDRFITRTLFNELVKDREPAYIRVSRNPSEDVYEGFDLKDHVINKAITVCEGNDITIIACGELVIEVKKAASRLLKDGIRARVIDMYCLKPLDEEAVIRAAKETTSIITVEEHSVFGGLGALVSQITAMKHPTKVYQMALPDEPAIAGSQKEILNYYRLSEQGIVEAVKSLV